MSLASRSKVKELFGESLRLPRESRAEFLARACGDDAQLLAEVASLLAAHDDAAEFLKEPTLPAGREAVSEGAGTRIGHYKLLELIGEGGFGSVFMAEQEEPIRRRVAVKVLKPGMDSRQVIARFEAERQALALMDHPNIARVLDAGTTSTGRPYFVMELVRGVPITQYCDQAHLSTAERLSVFLPVCHAVQHAHQKGIIHRDLKPSNVLVTLHDGKPVPKVIDFGIAKATEQRLTEKTLFTGFGQMIGTPAYMSPEQAEMSGLDIDTRSDVYSLGVLLYELLAGAPPFDPSRLQSAGIAEILRIIKEEEPPKPSTRVSTLGDVLSSVAARRGTEPKKLGALLRGDLDWVVMKALAKERQRRYDSAGNLAADLERYLEHQPVSAGPPGFLYRASKFVKRHRVGVFAGLLIVLALIGGMTGTTLALISARAAERRASANAADAEHKFTIAREGADLLLNDVVRELPKVPGTRDLQRHILDAALAHYEKLAAAKPASLEEQRRIWIAFQELGDAYLALGEKDQAQAAFARFHDLVTPAAAASPSNRMVQLDRAVSFERAGMLAYTDGRADDAAAALDAERKILEAAVAANPSDALAQRFLATCLSWTGRLQSQRGDEVASAETQRAALAIFEKLVAAKPKDTELMLSLVATLESLSEYSSEPRPMLERVSALLDQIVASDGDTPATSYARVLVQNQRARVEAGADRYAESRTQTLRAKEIVDRLVAAEPRNPLYQLRLVETLQLLADSAYMTGLLDESRDDVRAAQDVATRLSQSDDKSVEILLGLARSTLALADTAERAGELALARQSLERGCALYDELLARLPNNLAHLDGAAMTNERLGRIATRMGDFQRAAAYLKRANELSQRAIELFPSESALRGLRIRVLLTSAELELTSGDFDAANTHCRDAVAMAEQLYSEQPDAALNLDVLSGALDHLGDVAMRRVELAEAAAIRRRQLELCQRMLDNDPKNVLNRWNYTSTVARLADVLAATGAHDEARRLYEQALAQARELVALEPTNTRFQVQAAYLMLRVGQVRQQDGDLDAAIEQFTTMFDTMQAVVEREPQVTQYRISLADACEQLAQAYSARHDEARARESTVRLLAERGRLAESTEVGADVLNSYAWNLLTCEPEDLRDAAKALDCARRAAQRSSEHDATILDTLALAYFENGDAVRAAQTQERALSLLGSEDAARRASYQSRLDRYLARGK
jgi:serine/threonine protein kinase